MLNRGRTNHNFGKRVKYLHCNHEGCNAKLRLTKRLLVDSVILESAVGYEHHHVLEQVPGRGLSNKQKEIILECYYALLADFHRSLLILNGTLTYT